MNDAMSKLTEEFADINESIRKLSKRAAEILELMKILQRPENRIDTPADRLNIELFLSITDIYIREEEERIRLGNTRKSSRRVSVEINNTVSEFFGNHLGVGYYVERDTDGFVYVFKQGTAVCAIRFITDMGFIRGDVWYTFADELASKLKYGLQDHQIFFIVATLHNGLDASHISQYLGKKITSNWQFVHDRSAIHSYLALVQSHTACLENPQKQLIFLAAELHPNVLADDLQRMSTEQRDIKRKEVEQYEWIHYVDSIISEIRQL
ncbi:hypothetical protein [Paenibacillus silvisoli]|uniref:hypothetical protein n=1 Tax=Paenibacillus silvisoli TaxID=3110539 RepID=UPI0028056DE0|nr:hypothetical protein [Paenibacillus silvisoli]